MEHILESLTNYSIRLRDVVGYGADNVGYMLASYKNLVIKDFTKIFEQCITWAKRFPSDFPHSGVRRC